MADKKETEQNVPENKVLSIFEKEILRLPQELKQKLLDNEKYIKEVVDAINEKAGNFSIGFYINAAMEVQNNVPMPNFDKLTLNFLLDDFEKPIPQFNPKILLQEKFDELLIEEKTKNEYNEELISYKLKNNQNIIFSGNSISIVRENCFDAVYEDLQKFGSSFVYQDNRGFISALKTVDIHRNLLLQKFEKYVVAYVGAGSWLRGEKSNDFDIFVVVDDTDVKKMSRQQVKDQLSRIVWQMAGEVATLTGVQLHAQIYLLTDFWDALKDAHPVMFTFLRDGVPFYDRGIYSAWKELLKLGKIRPSAEAIDMHLNVGTQLLDRAKKMIAEVVVNDIYNAVLSPSQALLMLKGFNPTTPKETIRVFKDILCDKEKCIGKKEVTTLENTVSIFKKLEHDKSFTVTGKDFDKLVADAEEFLTFIKKMFEEISEEKAKESVLSNYSEVINQIQQLPGFSNLSEKELFTKFDKEFIKSSKLKPFVKEYIDNLIKAKNDYQKGKLKSSDVIQILKQARIVLSEVKDYRSKLIANDLGRKKLVINFDEKGVCEIINYEDNLYLIDMVKNEVFDLKTKDIIELSKINFEDNSKFKSIILTSDLIEKIKKVLDAKEISF